MLTSALVKNLVKESFYGKRKKKYNYSLRPIFFVLFEKSNFLREHHLLSCLPFKIYKFPKLPLKKFIKKLN